MVLLRFLIGACLGSFCCVAAERLPKGGSLLFPRSHCSACQTPLAWYELIPLLSFFWQKARCRHCHGKIPASCFWAELAGGLLLASYPLTTARIIVAFFESSLGFGRLLLPDFGA